MTGCDPAIHLTSKQISNINSLCDNMRHRYMRDKTQG